MTLPKRFLLPTRQHAVHVVWLRVTLESELIPEGESGETGKDTGCGGGGRRIRGQQPDRGRASNIVGRNRMD